MALTLDTAITPTTGTKIASLDVAGNATIAQINALTTKTDVGLTNADNTSDVNKPISTLTQAAIDAVDAGFGGAEPPPPVITAGTGFPYADVDADAIIAATSITDDLGINHYQRLITGLKKANLWADIESGFLFGDKHQDDDTGAAVRPFKGAANAAGTGVNGDYSVALNGSTNGYEFPNESEIPTAGVTVVALFKQDQTFDTAVATPSILISAYEGGTKRGMALASAGKPAGTGGASTIDYVSGAVSVVTDTANSGATAEPFVDNAHEGEWSFGACSYLGTTATVMGNSREVASATSATFWNNNTDWAIGKNPNNSYYFKGEIAAILVYDVGLTTGQLFELRLLLESVMTDSIDFPPSITFEGNSLTASAPGGGTTWPTQLLLETGWTTVRNENLAADGARQMDRVENQYYNKARRWVGANRAKRIFALWSGVNDLTASYTSAGIIASLKRQLLAAKADGFFVIIMPITPVASAGDGMTYGYSTTQQTRLTKVNTWIAAEGAAIADQFLNLNLIANTYAAFSDPTDTTYYVSGDGLHHNDAGRGLISDYFLANVAIPTA